MSFLQAILLGILQGITEFLPVSSSGHLVLGEYLLGLPVANLKNFDVFVHAGSLLAIVIYFRADLLLFLRSFCGLESSAVTALGRKEVGLILLASLPAAFVGLNFEQEIDLVFRHPRPVGIAMICVAVYFLIAEKKRFFADRAQTMPSWLGALLIGLAQAVAILPGVSRSGTTIATGLLCRIERSAAARFSFLLGIPALGGATLITAFKNQAELLADPSQLLILSVGFVASFLTSWFAIGFLMRFLRSRTLKVFAAYLFLVGFVLLLNA